MLRERQVIHEDHDGREVTPPEEGVEPLGRLGGQGRSKQPSPRPSVEPITLRVCEDTVSHDHICGLHARERHHKDRNEQMISSASAERCARAAAGRRAEPAPEDGDEASQADAVDRQLLADPIALHDEGFSRGPKEPRS